MKIGQYNSSNATYIIKHQSSSFFKTHGFTRYIYVCLSLQKYFNIHCLKNPPSLIFISHPFFIFTFYSLKKNYAVQTKRIFLIVILITCCFSYCIFLLSLFFNIVFNCYCISLLLYLFVTIITTIITTIIITIISNNSD